jgi:hypothetical protein
MVVSRFGRAKSAQSRIFVGNIRQSPPSTGLSIIAKIAIADAG